MKLYYSDASPYARCVRVFISYHKIKGIEEIIANPFDNSPELLRVNPLAKIPCLQLNDGSALFDSEVIMRFLDTEFGQSRLFGMRVNNWSQQCHFSLLKGIFDSAVSLRQEQLRDEEGLRSAFWTSRFEQALLRGLKEIETIGITHSAELTALQVMLVCLLEYIDFRHPDILWRNVAPALGLWLKEAQKADAFVATRPA
ncbi:glutathione S-transferase [Shewanella sp. Choline-02u-19]|jgi:glutathione S-transferase|uniref:glutathione S-transferase n=1 Tax=unclassified Shewanella TaxID=196818 RepID=UPI000C31E049|nr:MULTISPECIES: glutathione S-transferase N-terminal domain-containing protein [unclassified Shewanella]PKG55432.1 glutathione S-transferase [Shewanella sp. GutDb-MelDb]PKG76078.1 glutathione S-transferase [Shewanella sp. GutCb]PKH56641.1 glutathione S-transferase [Shewanella sp. Bg11-22]PKI30192.1 glutathione S-transferase [Shewanella sp. Choline-02u-19]